MDALPVEETGGEVGGNPVGIPDLCAKRTANQKGPSTPEKNHLFPVAFWFFHPAWRKKPEQNAVVKDQPGKRKGWLPIQQPAGEITDLIKERQGGRRRPNLMLNWYRKKFRYSKSCSSPPAASLPPAMPRWLRLKSGIVPRRDNSYH